MTGEYIPLERATARQLRKMLKGKLADHTCERFSKTVITDCHAKTTVITAEYSGRTWHWISDAPVL